MADKPQSDRRIVIWTTVGTLLLYFLAALSTLH